MQFKMRNFTFSLMAMAGLGVGIVAQDMPEITALAALPTNENQTELSTPPLMPGDDGYVDESDAARLAKRTPPAGVYVCDNTAWKGTCKWTPVNDYQCYNYPDDATSSFGVSAPLLARTQSH